MTDAECGKSTTPSGLALTEAVFESLPEPTAILDAEGRIVRTNDAWERFARENGLDGVDVCGRTYPAVAERAAVEMASEAADGIRAVLAGDRETFTHECPCRSPDGERWVRTTVHPIDHLDAPFALVRHENVTDKRRRRQVERERDHLESVAGILSHDLRNPLNVALERSKLIDERDAEHAGEIEQSLRRMNDIIQDALFLARESAVADPRPVDLGERAETAAAGLDLRLEVTDAPVVVAEESLLTQLLENVLRNAVEHSSTSPTSQAQGDAVEHSSASPDSQAQENSAVEGRTPTVTVGPLEDGFYVADDGPGIDPEDREAVFEAGHAAEATGGTGLGLAIVERIATVHGWSVDVTAGADGGARFEFSGVDTEE